MGPTGNLDQTFLGAGRKRGRVGEVELHFRSLEFPASAPHPKLHFNLTIPGGLAADRRALSALHSKVGAPHPWPGQGGSRWPLPEVVAAQRTPDCCSGLHNVPWPLPPSFVIAVCSVVLGKEGKSYR